MDDGVTRAPGGLATRLGTVDRPAAFCKDFGFEHE